MESELKILLEHGFISRKQLRDLLSLRFQTLPELREHLIEHKYLEQPDLREVDGLLDKSDSDQKPDDAPFSNNAAMVNLFDTAMRVAATDTTVLILGESGVGKTRLARLIHERSPRRSKNFITVSCGSIPEALLESELFGVEKGAYTGAVKTREGRFRKANGGTIFLDEIGELSPTLQVKLLRVIQEKTVEPLGSGQELKVDVRLIAATNRDLEKDTASGRFREDLYFRLNVVPLTMLPLRDRKEDILILSRNFLIEMSRKDNLKYNITERTIEDIMLSYDWPGNIRELQNCLERMTVLSPGGNLQLEDFPPRIIRDSGYKIKAGGSDKKGEATKVLNESEPLKMDQSYDKNNFPTLKEIEKSHIKQALEFSHGNVYQAAGLLKIHRNTLARKLEDMNINTAMYKKKARKNKQTSKIT